MMGTDQDKSLGKPAPRGRKAERRSPKSERQQSPMPDQPQEAKPQIEATVMSTDAAPIEGTCTNAPAPIEGESANATAPLVASSVDAAVAPI